MSRGGRQSAPSITIGEPGEGVRVEHVKNRGVVRLVRWSAGGIEADAVGVEVSDFCTRLGLTTDVLGPPCRFLLVAGTERPGGGHIVALFPTEVEARAAFVDVRRSEPGSDAWAEVSELTTAGMRRICWFGSTTRMGSPQKRTPRRPRWFVGHRSLRR